MDWMRRFPADAVETPTRRAAFAPRRRTGWQPNTPPRTRFPKSAAATRLPRRSGKRIHRVDCATFLPRRCARRCEAPAPPSVPPLLPFARDFPSLNGARAGIPAKLLRACFIFAIVCLCVSFQRGETMSASMKRRAFCARIRKGSGNLSRFPVSRPPHRTGELCERVCHDFDDGPCVLPFQRPILHSFDGFAAGNLGAIPGKVPLTLWGYFRLHRTARERRAPLFGGGLRYDHYPDIGGSGGRSGPCPELFSRMLSGGHALVEPRIRISCSGKNAFCTAAAYFQTPAPR